MAKAKRMIKRKNNNTETSQRRHEAEPKKRKIKMMFFVKLLSMLAIIVGVFFLLETKIGIEPQVDNIEKQRTFENLTIKNINVKYENGNSYFKLELANESDTVFQERNINIIFKNLDGTEYAQIKYNLSDININETFYINTSTNIDLTKASDFVIESE